MIFTIKIVVILVVILLIPIVILYKRRGNEG